MNGKQALTDELLKRISSLAVSDELSAGELQWENARLEARTKDQKSSSSAAFDEAGGIRESVKVGLNKKHWLNSRLSGLIVNRMHGGGWSPLQSEANRSLKCKSANSWLELSIKTALSHLPKLEWNFRELPPGLKDWVIGKESTIAKARAYQEEYGKISDLAESLDPEIIRDPWVKSFLDELKIRFKKTVSPDLDYVSNLSIYNSTSHSGLASLNFVKNLKRSKISKGKFK